MCRLLILAAILAGALAAPPASADDLPDCRQTAGCSGSAAEANALYLRALQFQDQGDTVKALPDFVAAARILSAGDPLRAKVAAAILQLGGRVPDAQGSPAPQAPITAEATDADALYRRALQFRDRGDTVRALPDFIAAAKILPADDPLRQKVAAAIQQLGGQVPDPAAAAATVAAIEASPQPAIDNPLPQPEVAIVPEPARRVALVIGNSTYRSVPVLANPALDARLISEALAQVGVDVTIAVDLDRSDMIAALKQFSRKADDADWAIVYYAGHGIEVAGTNYLVPVDAGLERDRDVPAEAIALDQVLSAVEGARTLHLVVLDACRNNPFEVQMKRNGAARAIGRGLTRVEPTGATLVAYAAKEGTTAADGDSGNSPFATAFARHIAEPGVEINMLFRYVRQDVLDATDKAQEPFVYGSLPPTPFYFVAAQ